MIDQSVFQKNFKLNIPENVIIWNTKSHSFCFPSSTARNRLQLCRNYFPVAVKPSTSLLSSLLGAHKRQESVVRYHETRKSGN